MKRTDMQIAEDMLRHRHERLTIAEIAAATGSSTGTVSCLFGRARTAGIESSNAVNVGVDTWEFIPVTLADIKRRSRELPVNRHWADVECRVKLG